MTGKFGKLSAAVIAAGITLSMCGCSDNGIIGSVEGKEIPTGLYIYFTAEKGYYAAQDAIKEEQGEALGTAEVTVFTNTIEGKTAADWLKDYAKEQLKRYVAVEKLFNDMGLELTAEERSEINEGMKALEDDLGAYAQYYGIEESSFMAHYENMGIGKSTLRGYRENIYKENAVFNKYYGKDGITPVSDEEIDAYLTENNAVVKVLKLSHTDYQGLLLDTDEEIAQVKELAQRYADHYNKNGDWIAIQYDYDLRQAQFDAWVDASDNYTEGDVHEAAKSPQDTIFDRIIVTDGDEAYNAYMQAAVDSATAEKLENADDADKFISRDYSSLGEKVTEFIWNTPADGKAVVFEDETEKASYVVVREDITKKTEWKEKQSGSVLHKLKDEEFEELLKKEYESYSVQLDENLTEGKYAPDRLKGIGK